jgi:hypothetical protein
VTGALFNGGVIHTATKPKHKTYDHTSHNKSCHYHRRRSRPATAAAGAPPAEPPTTMTTARDDCAEAPDQAAAQSREQQCAVFFAPPPPPPWTTTTTRTGWPAAYHPPATGPSWLRHCAGHWRCCRRGGEREGGAARRLAGFLAGVSRAKIETGRYKVGWMRLSAGGRKRGAAASVAGTRTGSQGPGTSSGVAGDGDGRGPDDRAADAPPRHIFKGGGSLPAPH